MNLNDYNNRIKELQVLLDNAPLSEIASLRFQLERVEDNKASYQDNLTEDDDEW